MSGTWHAPFTTTLINKASKLDVDHMVPLPNAHRSGGYNWDPKKKQEYANDLEYAGHLVAVTSSANRSKGDKGPEAWRPKEKAYWCQYAVDWMHIKESWGLSVTSEELMALKEMVGTCAKPVTIKAISSPYEMPKATSAATSSTMTLPEKTAYAPGGPDRDCSDFRSWKDAQEFYEIAGGPMTDSHRLDGDKNGIACERLPGAP